MDERAEKSLLAQGVCSLVVAGTCDTSKGQVAHPTKQDESKMSQLAHVEIGKRHTANADRQRAIGTIGVVQPSCIAPDRQRNPWSKHQGGVVGCGAGFAHGRGAGSSVVIRRDESVSVGYKIVCVLRAHAH